MSDHDALLAAILANPEEDMPRLLLAEWLDENAGTVECGACDEGWIRHERDSFSDYKCRTCSGTGRVSDGRAERAEFIRVQVELVRMPEGHCYGEPEAPRCDQLVGYSVSHWCGPCLLRRRERELWNASRLNGAPHPWVPVPKGIHITSNWLSHHNKPKITIRPQVNYRQEEITFILRRGFVSALICTWAAWREHADAILAAQPIERCKWTTPPTFDDMAKYGIRWEGPDDEYHASAWPSITFELPAEQPSQRVPSPIFPPPIRR